MPPLKIDVYSIMRNEIKILPYFLRHYETFADRIFVWDDQSDDGTREMLESHPKVTLLPLSHHGTDDVYFVEFLWPQYKQISRGHSDWVMCVDADEFVYHKNLISVLSDCLAKGKNLIRCEGWVMYHPTFPTTNGQIYDEVKVGWKDAWSQKTVVFTPNSDMNWGIGRHYSSNSGQHKRTGIKLLHFRNLGDDYYLERNKKNCKDTGIKFRMNQRYLLPDGTKGNPYDWYEKNKNNTINIVGGAL